MNGPITTEETYHVSNILRHYAHAKEKHAYFCDSLYPKAYTRDEARCRCKAELSACRELIKEQISYEVLQWDLLLNCEVWEAHEAIANGDTAHAVEECYDAIAILLRTIDVLEGRQKLGEPEKGEGK